MDFENWYDILIDLANKHGENVADVDAWREDYDTGKSPEDSFYGEFPNHKS